jgi:hypothetical protein
VVRGDLYGVPVLRSWAKREGWWGERRLLRAGRALRRDGAIRTLTPKGFDRWDLLRDCGLAPVDPVCFLRAQSLPLTLELLERQGIAPNRSTVALRGPRVDQEMTREAVRLCANVRRLIIAAPRGGAELAHWLRWEFGIPILPAQERGDAALCFGPAEGEREVHALELYGTQPDLCGLTLSAHGLEAEDREDLSILSILWEAGKLGPEALKIT